MQTNAFTTHHHPALTAPPDRGRPPRSTPCPFPRSPPLAPSQPNPFKQQRVNSLFLFHGRFPPAFPPCPQRRDICISSVILTRPTSASHPYPSQLRSGWRGWLVPLPRSGPANGPRASSLAGSSAASCGFSPPEEQRWHGTRVPVAPRQRQTAHGVSSRSGRFDYARSFQESSRRPPYSSVPNGLEPWPCDSNSFRTAGCSRPSASAST